MQRIYNRIAGFLVRRGLNPAPATLGVSILDSYIKSLPSQQNAVDIFRGEWSSLLPEPLTDLKTGTSGLFDDARIKWFVNEIGGISGKSVLELGPLEAGHTYMLEKLGESNITAIEASTRAYLKCLIVKELLDLRYAKFLCGDFMEYLRQEGPCFEVCVASGVLYHMQNPAELIALLSAHCTQHLLLWTHYYDHGVISANPALAPKFTGSESNEYAGFQHILYRQEYQTALGWTGFCGGSASTSHWMSRDDIIRCLVHFGFHDFRINFDHPNHPNGPAFALIATRLHK